MRSRYLGAYIIMGAVDGITWLIRRIFKKRG